MKKILAMVAALSVIMSVVAGGSIAYLTSTDSDTNTMTLGNVEIVQHEKERVDMTQQSKDDAANLRDFSQDEPLYPAVLNMAGKNANDPQCWAPGGASGALEDHYVNYGSFVTADVAEGASAWNGIWGTSLKNVRDKFVFVENTGKSDAYYRTIILMEYDETQSKNSYGQTMVHFNYNGNERFAWTGIEDLMTVEVDGEVYSVLTATYQNALKPGTVSRPSLLQVGLDAEATNEIVEQFGDTYDIHVLSQAVQTAGFDNAAAALNAAFGKVTEENVKKWFGETTTPPTEPEDPNPGEGNEGEGDEENDVIDPDNLPAQVPSTEVDGVENAWSDLNGDLNAPITVDDEANGASGVVSLENSDINVTGDGVLEITHPSTVFIVNCDFTMEDGKYIAKNLTGDTTLQIWFCNVTVNGELIENREVAASYLRNFGTSIQIYNN